MKLLLITLALFSFALAAPLESNDSCRDLLNYIYKEITVKNMGKSVKRLNSKMLLAMASALENSDKERLNLRSNPEVLSLIESMADIDPELEEWLKNNATHKRFRFWNFLPFNDGDYNKIAYQEIVHKWAELQKNRPELFKGLSPRHRIDEWDLKTSKLLESFSSLNQFKLDSELRGLTRQFANSYQNLGARHSSPATELLRAGRLVEQFNKSLNKENFNILRQALDEFDFMCSSDEFNSYLGFEQMACPAVSPENTTADLSGQLASIARLLSPEIITASKKPGRLARINIQPYEYKNINYKGSFCLRTPKMVDTAVIHHSATESNIEPQNIHDTQVVMHENDRGSDGEPDPWYMIAYNYVIKSPYETNEVKAPEVYQGRPDEMKGAHAGAYVNLNQIDSPARKEILKSQIACGWNTDKDRDHKIDRKNFKAIQSAKGEIKSGFVSANISSVGVLVMGNYAPDILDGRPNPTGYPAYGQPRMPSDETLRASARLICELRRNKYPHLRKITDHNWIKIKKSVADGSGEIGTCCPGTVYKRMNRILQMTEEECPGFDFALDISPEDKICDFLK